MNDVFLKQVLSNKNNAIILERISELGLKDAWLVAGCLFQTVWNVTQSLPSHANIKDYDIFYFDPYDLSESTEQDRQKIVENIFCDLGVSIEAKNQARVHLWYKEYFGYDYPELKSSKDGVDRFLILETCVGVASTAQGFEVYSPNGVDGIYAGTLTPNPLTNHKKLFLEKANSYKSRWPWLRINV